MKHFKLALIGLALSFNTFAAEVDFRDLSQALIQISEQVTEIKELCGTSLENVTSKKISESSAVYDFNLVSRGAGRLGWHVFSKCEVKIFKDTGITDAPAAYSVEYKQIDISK